MYTTNLPRVINAHTVLAAVIKVYESLRLQLKQREYKNDNSKEYLSYMLKAVDKGHTVLDIGRHKKDYFFVMLRIVKHNGRLIAFENNEKISSYLLKMKQLLQLNNITIEDESIAGTEGELLTSDSSTRRKKPAGALVIDFEVRTDTDRNKPITKNTIDNYCTTNCIKPGLIKFKLQGNEVEILKGATETIQRYKPTILFECGERNVSRETLLKTFGVLYSLKYSGYFILDTMKIPLTSFDFNLYQNEILGYYCNNFIFE